MKSRLLKLIFCLIAVNFLFINGCTFHLRNQNTLAPALQNMRIISDHPYDSFTKQLKRELGLLNNQAPSRDIAQLIIHSYDLSYRMPIIGSSQQARIYQYSFQLEYSLKVNDKLLINKKKIKVGKLLTLNQHALLSTNNQQALLTIEIQHAAILQLINELKAPLTLSGKIQKSPTKGLAAQAKYEESSDIRDPDFDSESPMLPYQDSADEQ
jgi:outer membrane lipopolysaccharide assembly protein LptE/RlpB